MLVLERDADNEGSQKKLNLYYTLEIIITDYI